MAELSNQTTNIDLRSGFCKSKLIFYSKRKPISLPPNPFLDVPTFVSSQVHRGKVAFIDATSGCQLSFSDVWKAVHSVSSCLSDMGIRKGHVVLILSPNSIFYPIVCLSVMFLGAIITTANPLNTPQEISKQIDDSNTTLVFTVPQLLPKLTASSNTISVVLMNHNSESPSLMNYNINIKIVSTLADMMRKESNPSLVRDRVNQDDTATLLYSSGTTGASKGVISSHSNFIALIRTTFDRFGTNPQDEIYIATVPMFHIYGLAAFVMGFLALGSTVVILSKFDMNALLSAVEKYKATYLPLVPPILIGLVNKSDAVKRNYDLSSLRTVLCGGAPLSKEVIEGFLKKYPCVNILQGYALTESTGGGASTDTMEESLRYGTAGLLTPSMEAEIVDPDSSEALSMNQTGELWLRGPTL